MANAPRLGDFTTSEIKEAFKEFRHDFSIAVYGSENYFNLGSIVRIAHCFLVKDIYAIDCPAMYEKATMGTHKWETIHKLTKEEFLENTADRSIVAFEKRRGLLTHPLYGFEYPKNPILLFGSEKNGLPDDLIDRADSIVSITQYGLQNDLNMANACGIAVYDWLQKHYTNVEDFKLKY